MAQFSEHFYQTPEIVKIEHDNFNITKEDAKIQIHTQPKEDQQRANIVTIPIAKKGDGQNLENWGFMSESTNQTVSSIFIMNTNHSILVSNKLRNTMCEKFNNAYDLFKI